MSAKIKEFISNELFNLFVWIFQSLEQSSYYICLFIAFFCIFAYILGFKKYSKGIPFSIMLYYIIKSIGTVFK